MWPKRCIRKTELRVVLSELLARDCSGQWLNTQIYFFVFPIPSIRLQGHKTGPKQGSLYLPNLSERRSLFAVYVEDYRIYWGEQGEQKTGGIRYYCCYGRESEMEGGGSSQGLDLWVAASGPAPCGVAMRPWQRPRSARRDIATARQVRRVYRPRHPPRAS